MDDAAVDFAVAAWREENLWQLVTLPPRASESLDLMIDALRAQPGETGTLGLVSIAEELFLIVRVRGEDVRLLVSDVIAADDWPLGADALDRLGIPEDVELDDAEPAGDLRIVDDLGVGPEEIELLLEDTELYPDEVLASIAARIGFGELFDAALEQLPD
ncbi:MAG: tRNA adenosine deaminase-associated protein [Candidatus Nanopelagicales bacterium]